MHLLFLATVPPKRVIAYPVEGIPLSTVGAGRCARAYRQAPIAQGDRLHENAVGPGAFKALHVTAAVEPSWVPVHTVVEHGAKSLHDNAAVEHKQVGT